ncbi:hypothetical protein KFK09_001657 [Dendrobium nobile]|uniref:RNase H type-1 domain-containing protein n=1 Tax=Dendrobium nobile TaxID=94219 RepID=A0A8T3C5K7_DENNO|nr:hypothetical protein KFK09_001657 [Dendrobium nobile]
MISAQNINVLPITDGPITIENPKYKFSVLDKVNEDNEVVSNVSVKDPDIYVSIDSMLNLSKDILDNVPKQVVDLSNENEKSEKEGCEEGEFIPNQSTEIILNKEAGMNMEDKQDTLAYKVDVLSSFYDEEGDYTKVGRKKGNKAKHEGIRMDAMRIIENIKYKVYQLYTANIIFAMEKVVRWVKPVYPFVKLNSDGSVSSNTAGMGGIIRNFNGDVIIAYASPLNHCKVIYDEMRGISYGLELCHRTGITNVAIEVDALSLIQMINKDIMCYPDFFHIMRKIKSLLAGLNFTLIHIFREGNACADFLAKKGSLINDLEEFSNSNLPQQLRGLVRLDKLGLPYIRVL